MSNEIVTPTAAENPPAAPTLSPEDVVEQLRTLRSHIGEITPLTTAQRKVLRSSAKASNDVLQASINVINAAGLVEQAVGQPAAEVRDLLEEANRWTAVEDELRALLNGVAGANLIRRQRVAFVSGRAYVVGAALARDPAHAVLVPHVQEIRRLKRLSHRKKAQTPGPAPAGTGTSAQPKP